MNLPHRMFVRVIRDDAWWQMEPLPLVPATWMAFQGNWTFLRSCPMRSKPGWIIVLFVMVARVA